MDERPIRVIYAKLTSTGAYDVVAHTANVPLERARTLAEQLLPGNPPLDASVDELIGYMRQPAGGHIVMRFARYPWQDGERGDVYSTDIVRVPDDAFGRVRCNPFAMVQRSDAVFDVLAQLPDFDLAVRTSADEHERLRQLSHIRDEARTVIANALAGERVLLVHTGDRAGVMELFTLLLPPLLRPQLTFLTQTFRVPSLLPRVTLVDRQSANLRDGAWTMLPSPDVDVPMELAGRLVRLADDPAVLELAHELHDDAYGAVRPDDRAPAGNALRAGVIRVTRIADVARALRAKDVPAVLALIAHADTDVRERAAALRRLHDVAEPRALRDALVQMLHQGGESATRVKALLESSNELGEGTTAALIDALPSSASAELMLALAGRAAAEGDVARVLVLIARDRRSVSAHLERVEARLPDDVVRLLAALRRATAPHFDIAAAAHILTEASSIAPSLADSRAVATLHGICRDTVADALPHVPAALRAVPALRQLLDASAAYRQAAGAAASGPAPLPDSVEDARRFADAQPQAVCAALGAALLDRALDAERTGANERIAHDMSLVQVLIERAGTSGSELVRHLLADRGVAEHDLVAMPGADALLPLLGGSHSQAVVTRRLVAAIGRAAEHEDGIRELAGAVYAAHAQNVRIAPGTDISARVIAALRTFADSRAPSTPAAELCLALLPVITSPGHMAELEDAALGSHMSVRLRRLDHSIAGCRAAAEEQRYDRIAAALESGRPAIDRDARERLRVALGTGGVTRRLMRVVASVMDREAS